MKHIRFLLALPLLMFISLFIVGGSCTDTSPQYYVTFSADGQSVTFDKGITVTDDEAFVVQDYAQGATYIYAGSESVSDTSNLPDNYILIRVFTTDTGTWQLLASILTVWYYVDGTEYGAFVDGDTTTVTITKYGEVGDTIEGTFSSKVRDNGNTIEITDGQFRVKRVADDSVTFF
jgi:hypothetical protein